MKRIIEPLLKILSVIRFIVIAINAYMIIVTGGQIVKTEELKDKEYDCILVLGAGVWGDEPSPLLRDRIIMGVEAWKINPEAYLLMSGDHLEEDYDEPLVMKKYAIRLGADGDNIKQDRYGLSTYDSLWRVKNLYKAEKVLIVTQSYHIYRALYIARQLGIEAYGLTSDLDIYGGEPWYYTREIAARVKDFINVMMKPEAQFTE